MKKLLAIFLALVMTLSFAACTTEPEASEPASGSESESASETSVPTFDTLAGKTPLQLYNEALASFNSMTNFEIKITENMITAYLEESYTDEYNTQYKTDGANVSYDSNSNKMWYVDQNVYTDNGFSKEKKEMDAETFASQYTLDRASLLIPLEDAYFSGIKFFQEGVLYYINVSVSVDDFVKYVGFQTTDNAEYKVYFNSDGKLVSVTSKACYVAQSAITVTMVRDVELVTIGTVSTITAPDGADTYRVAPLMNELDMTALENLDGVSDSSEKTDYVKLVIDGDEENPVIIRLYSAVAPTTVDNFKTLVANGFYNGLTFHRVKDGFVVQGGDPNGDGTGGSDKKIVGEFTNNGFTNNLKHIKGVVSMARTDVNSASSQFFIVQGEDQTSLDNNYASFGYVVYGMDVIDAIAAVETDDNDKPKTDVVITSASFVTVS